jgi:multiple sugar transport system ATP-binding protein
MHIYADLGGQEVCAITSERVKLARGGDIQLNPRLDKVHLFDAETGKVIA